MGIHTIRLPDVGEGIAEAELVEWPVKIGDIINEDDVVAVVMTDKAAVEVPSPIAGKVMWLGGEVGEPIPVGGKLIQLEVKGEGNDSEVGHDESSRAIPEPLASEFTAITSESVAVPEPAAISTSQTEHSEIKPKASNDVQSHAHVHRHKSLAAPSVRARAKAEGIDLRNITGTGPAGRINHQDLTDFIEEGGVVAHNGHSHGRKSGVKEIKMIGMRRKIAEKMAISKSRIPHITIVEEIDVTELEELRAALNKKHAGERSKLTLLPFMMRAIVEGVREQPVINSRYDDDAGIVRQHGAVNIGIATQTENGLNVTVVHHAEAANLWENAGKVSQLAEEARNGTIKLDNLSGGTITITSLGALGAIVTTPIINHPEVAIVGINKMQTRPMWDGQQFQPRKMMNISCSFDHRVVDGWDAAVFVQKLKTLLEQPAMLFVEG